MYVCSCFCYVNVCKYVGNWKIEGQRTNPQLKVVWMNFPKCKLKAK